MNFRLSKKEHETIRDLNTLISIATNLIESWYDTPNQRTRFRTWVMWNNLGLMVHNATSLMAMMKLKQIYSSQALLRILIEQFINMNYFYLTKNYESFVRYLYHGDVEFIDGVEKYRSFSKKIEFSNAFTEKDFDEIRNFRDKSILDLKKYGHELKKMPPLRDRAVLIDIKNGNNELEQLYIGWYITNSTGVHSSKDILISMTYSNSLEELLTGYSNDKDSLRILELTIQLLASSIKFAIKQSRLVVETSQDESAILKKHSVYS
jgi:hypothetical protein